MRGRRTSTGLLVGICVSIAALTACTSISPSRDGATVSATTDEYAPPVRAAESPLRVGIAYGNTLPGLSDAALAQALDVAVRAGVHWIRIDMSWAAIQPRSAQAYQWDPIDRVVGAAIDRGLAVLPVLAYTPPWARVTGCDTEKCAPADPAAFATFAAAAATRYAPVGLHTWEIWNEPNSVLFWQPRADPVRYGALLRATAASLRRADPAAFLLSGGVAMLPTGNGDIAAGEFLAGVGADLRLVDAIAAHPYTYPFLASRLGAWRSPWNEADSGLGVVRDQLDRLGLATLPVWITEYGAPTGGRTAAWDGNEDTLAAAAPDHVTEEQQARIATDAVHTAAADGSIGALIWYADRDTGTDPTSNESYYGLRRADGSPKPALAAFSAAVAALPPGAR